MSNENKPMTAEEHLEHYRFMYFPDESVFAKEQLTESHTEYEGLEYFVISVAEARRYAILYHQEQIAILSTQDVSDEAIVKYVESNWGSIDGDVERSTEVQTAKWIRSIYSAKLAEREKEVSDWKWRFDELDRIRTDEANNWKKIAEEKHLRIAELEAQLKQKGGDQ